MGKNTHLEQDTIAQIIALKESGMQTKYIVSQLGVSGHSVRRWVAKFNQRGSKDTPTNERRPGIKKKTSNRCKNMVKRQLENNPRLTARKVKEDNSRLLGDVSFVGGSILTASLVKLGNPALHRTTTHTKL